MLAYMTLYISSFIFHSAFLCQLHAHIYNVLLEDVCCCFLRNELFTYLNMMLFVGSRSFISLPSFMFVSAVVSEIRKLNQNKEKSEIDYIFQFKTFPWHTFYPFLTRGTFEHMYSLLESHTPQTESVHQDFYNAGPSLYTQYYTVLCDPKSAEMTLVSRADIITLICVQYGFQQKHSTLQQMLVFLTTFTIPLTYWILV